MAGAEGVDDTVAAYTVGDESGGAGDADAGRLGEVVEDGQALACEAFGVHRLGHGLFGDPIGGLVGHLTFPAGGLNHLIHLHS